MSLDSETKPAQGSAQNLADVPAEERLVAPGPADDLHGLRLAQKSFNRVAAKRRMAKAVKLEMSELKREELSHGSIEEVVVDIKQCI